jgi:aminoglycoside N3'-acetyltransferase
MKIFVPSDDPMTQTSQAVPQSAPAKIPASLAALIKNILPQIHAAVDGPRALRDVREIIATDRWNNFTEFHETAKTVARAFEQAGAKTEIHSAPTGGQLGSGKWIIHEAQDVLAATLEVVAPVRVKLADYRECPWHAVQWTAGTPPEGAVCELVAIDNAEQLAKLKPGSLRNKIVLIGMDIWDRGIPLVKKEAYGVICESNIKGCPDAVAWAKFGWGGFPIHQGPARMVGMVLSANQAAGLRKLIAQHGKLQVKMKVDVRRFAGTHDVVSGLIEGRDDPQSEIWVVAHDAEPGAIDNASGVACCLETARAINHLIASGAIPRPRRTIRLVIGYECYGFFHLLEHQRRFQTPIAGLCIDGVGAKPEDCERNLLWNGTVPSSASFVDQIGPAIVKAALAIDNPGYVFGERGFTSTEDTLLGDPQYGFPCPWFSNHPVKGYHSSADDMDLLDPRAMATCTAAAAAYLYYLADAGTTEALELADWETEKALRELSPAKELTRWQVAYTRHRHDISLKRLQRFLWTGRRSDILSRFAACEARVADAAEAVHMIPGGATPPAAEDAPASQRVFAPDPDAMRLVPLRKIPLTPTAENVLPPTHKPLGIMKWMQYWADGNRSVEEIYQLFSLEPNVRRVRPEWVAAAFRSLAELGYVQLLDPEKMLTEEALAADLRKLGLKPGMEVMVHSSLSKLGAVQGGAKTVINALLAAIAPGGTLVAPSFNHARAKVFNVLTTPTINGAIPDALWRDPRALRSVHSTHAMAAIGPKAEIYTDYPPTAGLWAADSPIGRLIQRGGYILSLGVNQYATTAAHVAEISMNAPCLDQFGNTDYIVLPDGTIGQIRGIAWRDAHCPVDIKDLEKILDARGLQTRGKVGQADCILVKGVDFWNTRREQLRDVCSTCPVRPQTNVR